MRKKKRYASLLCFINITTNDVMQLIDNKKQQNILTLENEKDKMITEEIVRGEQSCKEQKKEESH